MFECAPRKEGNERLDQVRFETRDDYGYRVVVVRGEIDMNTAQALEEALSDAAEGGRGVAVDLTHCSYFDSSAIAVLIRKRKTWGRPFPVVVPADSFFRRLFDIAGIADLFRLVASPAELREAEALPEAGT
jgi:anti-anti-sigma factor